MNYFIWILLGYVSGSVMYAYLLPKIWKGIDIRQLSDDGNPGTANAFKYGGIWIGSMVVICELAKGFFPVFFAARRMSCDDFMFLFVMAAPVLGHAFPVWYRAKGGKSIAVSFGVMMGLFPEIRPLFLLAFFYLFFTFVIVINPHFFRSVVTFFMYSAGSLFWVKKRIVGWGCIFISSIVVLKHLERYQGERISVGIRKRKISIIGKGEKNGNL